MLFRKSGFVPREVGPDFGIAPQQYGEPLRKTLKGYWKLRVGDYRVVFKVVGAEVRILGIGHRKHVYDAITKRTAP